MRDYGDDVFKGTAEYYAKYRAPYPDQIFKDIASKYNLNGSGKLLDLGCGTGELAIPLAQYFRKVLAIDPDSTMLRIGVNKANKLNIGNIEWQKGSSKVLNELKSPFKLVTMGQSFHWMDGETVLHSLYGLVEKGGGVAIIGTTPTKQSQRTVIKDQIINDLVVKYLGPKRRAGIYIYEPTGQNWESDLFPNSKFAGFKKYYYITKVSRSTEQEIGNIFSMSWASKKLFGSQALNFEHELRQNLIAIAAGKKFENRIKFCMHVLTK